MSHQTVSRVLNDHPHVRPATRERVQQAIAELGYRRNAAARSLVTRRSGVIGLLTPRTDLYGPTSSMIAVEVAAREAGYFVSLASVADTSAAALGAAVEHFKDQAAEAVVLIAPEREWLAAARHRGRRHPGRHDVRRLPGRPAVARVGGDGQPGRRPPGDETPVAARAPRHRVRRRPGDVAGGDGPAAIVAGRVAACRARRRRVYPGDWSSASGYAAGRRIVAEGVPTAVFAANDQMALGVLSALAEAGLDVPGDVSVAGFDDVPDAAYFTPALTTVHQDFAALASRCVAVLERILRGEAARSVRIRPELVVRASTAQRR